MKRRLAGIAVFLALSGACSKSPTAPAGLTPPVPVDLTGAVWTGFIRISSCSSPTGCPSFVDALYGFTLTISSGSRIEAKLEATTPEAYVAVMPGVIHADGTHVFSGMSSNGRVEIRELRLSKDRAANITGTISYTSNVTSRDPRTLTGVIPSATLQRDVRNPGTAGIASLAGTWYGTGRTDTCNGFSCGSVGVPGKFTITIRESGSRFTALLDSDIWARKVVELDGVRQPDNSVRFTGPWDGDTGRTGEFRHFTLSIDPAMGLVGTFDWFETAPVGTATRTGTILSASRDVVFRSPGAYQGSWRGGYVARTCSGDCQLVSFTNVQTFAITLQQVGLSVSGRAFVTLDGSVSANGATLSGEAIVEPCLWDFEGSVCTQRIRALSVRVDDFGRLLGTFEYFKEGWSGSLHYRYTITAELRDVIRQLQ